MTVAGTSAPPASRSVTPVLMLAGVMASLNVTVSGRLIGTFVAPAAGVTAVTVGPDVSGAVVNVHV